MAFEDVHQLHVGFQRVYDRDRLAARLAAMETQLLFTYGRREHGTTGIEAETGESCAFLRTVAPDRLRCAVHEGGHEFPLTRVAAFVAEVVGAVRAEAGR